ncbi:MAG: 1-(5-phosphoribosyl)-5-[(5-phosphoribosylamino)methylideneamino]imidazole-4-carboxamide isomerase [Bacillota bacterium]|nr:1-(5-phosphoribosyl)-5-[(5-phosphoribosylamino)methylideneamino]imidazole-4-carboxamide isomerase [Bacillota bacterium]
MIIIPAIDLKNGKCVRLRMGDFDTEHVVAKDALKTAKSFAESGAELIHVVDLDGAKTGSGENYEIVRKVCSESGAKVELGGGIRTIAAVEHAFDIGVYRVVIGSAAISDPEFIKKALKNYSGRIAVGIDARGGTVRTDGWLKDSGKDYIETAKYMESIGVKTIIFTDIEKDGLLSGPSFERTFALKNAVSCEIVASGGLTTVEDVRMLRDGGVDAAIAGKAIYEKRLDLKEAIREAVK